MAGDASFDCPSEAQCFLPHDDDAQVDDEECHADDDDDDDADGYEVMVI